MLFLATQGFSQSFLQNPKYGPDEEARKECAKNLSLYMDGFKAGDYKTSYKFWREAYRICPGAQLSALQRGRTIYQSFIETASDEATKQAYVDSLLSLYDARIKYFPSDAPRAMEYKVRDLLLYRPEQSKKALAMITKILDEQGSDADAEIIAFGMVITTELYQKKEVSSDDVMNYYTAHSATIEKQLQADPNNETVQKAKESLDYHFVNCGVANCDNLIPMYTPRFEQNPNDLELVKKIVSLLGANRCIKSDLYFKAVIALQKLEPSPEGAINVARLYAERGEYAKALPFYKDAAAAQATPKGKGDIFLLAADAMIKAGNKAEAKSLARQAIDANPSSGLAYIMIANIIGSEKCNAADPILSAGPYFLAVDYLRKAKQVDSSISSDADRLISSYSAAFPSKQDLFSYAYEEGQSITVGCGINERTTVRAR